MTLPPTGYIAELPLKAPGLGAFRLFPGQLLRGRVAQVAADQVTLDLGYATLTASARGLALQPGQRVLIQVGTVGRDTLTLQLLPETTAPLLPTATAPDPTTLLKALGVPSDDPLLALAQRLATPDLPAPIAAGLLLTFGAVAESLAPSIAGLLGRRVVANTAIEDLESLPAKLHLLLAGSEPERLDTLQILTDAPDAIHQPAAALSLALSTLAGLPTRYWLSPDGRTEVLIDRQSPHAAPERAPHYRFLARVDLAHLGPVGIHCLYAPQVCLGRLSAEPEALTALRGPIDEAAQSLSATLGRPVHLSVQSERAPRPIDIWLAEQPWESRGVGSRPYGTWLDASA